MYRIKELNKKYREVDAELADLYTMSEEAACDLYEVCDKEEAIQMLQQRLQAIDDEIEIIERGDHESLLKDEGKYYQLYTGQFELE